MRTLRGLVSRVDDHDGWLLASVLALCLLGTVMVFGAGSFRGQAGSGQWGHFYYLVKHVTRLGLGLLAMMLLANLDYRVFRRKWWCWSLLAVGLLLTFLPVVMKVIPGVKHMDINRWLPIFGLFPVQPLEFAKVALVLFLAERLSRLPLDKGCTLREWGGFLAAPIALILILVGQPNYGNALVIGLLTVGILFIAGIPLRILMLLPLPVAGGVVLGYFTVPKIATRLHAWWDGLQGEGLCYQVEQSLIGVGAGGLHGLGLGASHQRFWFLPESHTDFIFSVLGEELGLIGTLATLMLFTVFVWRGLNISRRAADRFGQVAAAGLTILLFLYVTANLSMVLGLAPVMGLPLPFVSYGGSALVTNLAVVGLLLSIDRYGRAYQEWRTRVEARLNSP